MPLKGMGYLRSKLNQKRSRVLTRYRFYEQKYTVEDLHISTPPGLERIMPRLGWCTKAVDVLADRLQVNEFDNDNFEINTIFDMNNRDIFFDSAMLSALITSCCFIYISLDENDYPLLQVIDGGNATGILDETTGLLTEGYAVLKRDKEWGTPILEAYFQPGRTWYYPKGEDPYYIDNVAPAPLLVPIINRSDAARPFGHSRISRSCMKLVASACRTILRSEISAEFYSYPQKYIVGLDPDSEPMEKWRASMAAFLALTKDEDGSTPSVGQFTQQSMTPHNDQLRMLANTFAGETGLTGDDLGFATDNPTSAEAIKASHENLRIIARKAQTDFGRGFLNVGYLAACVRDNFQYRRNQFYLTKLRWQPIFEPDSSMLSAIGDGVNKINQALPGYIGPKQMHDLTGFDGENS